MCLFLDEGDEGSDGLACDAVFAEEDGAGAGEKIQLVDQFQVRGRCFHFLFIRCFDLIQCFPFSLSFNEVENEVAILLVGDRKRFYFEK